ncbi:MAG: aminotransferase class III-fold pyridoxal phosphate-dependent enzyme [Anaerolineae bacterium]|nr:aminotransferase class III-fold pyridoxal phosphate-dependent enzyme [Thermoflexales bacterium]MDW8407533.1 aminotransferase class III-fold pyridoxal phosphate-dependent enzyme [Anaerolineae bacterium]
MSKENLSTVWARAFDIAVERGEGAYLIDRDGRRYLDFTCGIAVANTGHTHPRIVRAIQEQAAKLIHGQIGVVTPQAVLDLTDELRRIVPPELDTYFFANSGAEAIEAAVKLARQATGRTNVIVFEGSFHGRTHLAMAMTTSKNTYRFRYQPLPAGVFVAPYPYCYHCPIARRAMTPAERARLSAGQPDGEGCCGYAIDQLHYVLKTQTAPQETAAMVIEPVLGEGGYVVPPRHFIQTLRRVCDEHGILLVFDEIQTGFGRTGKFFALEHFGVVPDILVMAKGIASGMPLSGVAARRNLMAKWPAGAHGGTYAPNVISAAAAVETIRVLREERLIENSAARGEQLLRGLRELQTHFPALGDVRGLGCMVGVELIDSQGAPDKALTDRLVSRCADQNLLLLTCGTYGNVIRWIPPLIVTEEQIDQALHIFAAALDQIAAQ